MNAAPSDPPADTALRDPHGLSGRSVAHYAVGPVLGGGGMGIVYAAEDTRLHRTVALKFLPPALSRDEEAKRRFVAEAQAASALDHPNICTIHEIGETDDGRLFIAMAHYSGQTLKAVLAQGALPVETALSYAVQLARALDKAHAAGIVHRDIKPANVMVTADGVVKLLDFGLAKVHSLQLTQVGTTMGTVAYMSPEQARGEEVDGRSDLWSLGVVLYEMLTGTLPFKGAYEQATIYNILTEAPPPLSSYAPGVPFRVEGVVERCLEKTREARYATAADLVRDLEAMQQPDPVARPQPARLRLRLSAPGSIVAGLVLLIALLFAYFAFRDAAPPVDAARNADLVHVAVLPFDDVADDSANRAFIDGLVYTVSSTLIGMERFAGRLSLVPAADVLQAGLTTASEAAQTLHADLVVTGSFWRTGSRVRFTLALFDAREGRQTRSERIDEETTDLLALQDSVALKLANLLGVQLDAEAETRLAAGSTTSEAAFDAYTQGRGYLLRYENARNVDRAIALFGQALAADSLYALAHAGLGEAYWRRYEATRDPQWVEAAVRSGRRAVRLAPELSPVRVTLGMIYKGTGRYAEAEGELLRALERDPRDAFAHQQLAATYYYLGRLDEAEASYKRSIALKPDYWGFYNNLGFLYNAQGRHEEAATVYRRVVELRPDNPWGYNNVGVQYERLGQLDEAAAWYRRATTASPAATAPTAQAFRNLASLAYRQRDFAAAVRGYRAALRLDSVSADGWSSLAYAAHWAGDSAAERAALQRALRLNAQALSVNPQDEDALTGLAMNTALAGAPARARAYLDRVAALPQQSVETLIFMATTRLILGERDAAFAALEAAAAAGATRTQVEASAWLETLQPDPRYARLFPPGG